MSAIRKGTSEANQNLEGVPNDIDVSVYADMQAALSAEVEDKHIELPVPTRPNLFVRYNATFEFDVLNRWMKSATKSKVMDPKKLALLVLHATCIGTGVVKDGKNVEFLVDGRPQTYDSESIQSMLKTMGGWSGAITSMYSNDGHMMMTMNRILTEAGYSEMDLDDLDGYDPLGI